MSLSRFPFLSIVFLWKLKNVLADAVPYGSLLHSDRDMGF